MPLLLCPNDDAAMQTLKRDGVEIDICPTCRGVWLDRGELEKLLSAARENEELRREVEHRRPPEPERRPHDVHRYRDDAYYRKKKKFDIFDIFD